MASWILHSDTHLVVCDKPSGELVVPGWARGEPTTMSRLRDTLGARVHPVHRLDRGTSGVVIFARDPTTAAALGEQLRQRAVEKRYLALLRGRLEGQGVIDHPVRRREEGDERVAAVTEYRGLGSSPVARCCLVEARPRTGRLHQIRRHFKHLSHPIIGDVTYGDGRVNREFRATWGLHRLALHAFAVRFEHPASGEAIEVVAPVPADLAKVLAAIDLGAAAAALTAPGRGSRGSGEGSPR
ncbi:MAG: pseudouridine synthase [Polyangiaceae bacterium]